MYLKEIGISRTNLVESAQYRELLESACKCGIEPLDSISHEVNVFLIEKELKVNIWAQEECKCGAKKAPQ